MYKRLLSVFIALLLLAAATSAAGAEETETISVSHIEELDEMFGGPYLAWDTIPDDVRTDAEYGLENAAFLSLYGHGAFPYATTLEITQAEGDAELLDALLFDGEQLHLDYLKLNKPGEVSFHIHAEGTGHKGELYTHDGDYTLKTIAYEGPVMEFLDDVDVITMRKESIPYPEFFPRIARYTDYAQGMPICYIWLNGGASSGGFSTSFMDEGDNTATVRVDFGGVSYSKEFTLRIVPYAIEGSKEIYRGQSTVYSVAEYDMWNRASMADGFTIAAEGNGISIEDDGTLTVAEDADIGETVKLTAVRDRDGTTIEREVTVCELPWVRLAYRNQSLGDYGVPVPDDSRFTTDMGQEEDGTYYIETHTEQKDDGSSDNESEADGKVSFRYELKPLNGKGRTDRKLIKADLKRVLDRNTDAERGEFTLNGIPGIVLIRNRYENEETFELEDGSYRTVGLGALRSWTAYVVLREPETELQMTIKWQGAQNGSVAEASVEDIRDIVARMTLKGEPAEIRDNDPVPAIAPEGGKTILTEGESVQFTVSEESLALAETWGEIVWSVTDAEGNAVKGITVSDGLLKLPKNLIRQGSATLYVNAAFSNAADTAVSAVAVTPALKKLYLSSTCEGDFAYVGSEETLTASGDPWGALIGTVEWTIDKPELAELVTEEQYTNPGWAQVKLVPLQTGKITVTAVNADGKKATLKLTIGDQPVTDVKIIVKKGEPKAGGTMQMAAELTPEKPNYPKVYWTVDVESDVATIDSNKGTLKIKKGVEPGTAITVTCYAHGAPESLNDTMIITVE